MIGQGLTELGYDLTSTGGSAAAIEGYKLDVTRVEDLTQFPEMLDGRHLSAEAFDGCRSVMQVG